MQVIQELNRQTSQGTGTVAFAATAGAAAAWLCTGALVHTLLGGAIALYASAITMIVQRALKYHVSLSYTAQLVVFFAVAITSTVALCFAAATLGFPLTATSVFAITAANISAMVLGLKFWDVSR